MIYKTDINSQTPTTKNQNPLFAITRSVVVVVVVVAVVVVVVYIIVIVDSIRQSSNGLK